MIRKELDHVGLNVADLEKSIAFPCGKSDFPNVVTKVQGYGLEIVSGPKEQRGGETILFRDPSGNILEVCYPSISEWKASQT